MCVAIASINSTQHESMTCMECTIDVSDYNACHVSIVNVHFEGSVIVSQYGLQHRYNTDKSTINWHRRYIWQFKVQIRNTSSQFKFIIQKWILIYTALINNLYWDPTSDIETIHLCLSRFFIYRLRDIRVTLCLWYFNMYICMSL